MTDVLTELLPGLHVSRETLDRLREMDALVRKWSPSINLVSKTTLPDVWGRHILDSAQLFGLAPARPRHWADLGSGAGFPALVIAILFQGADHQPQMTLVESDQRKAAFLRTCARTLALQVDIHPCRIEDLPPLRADVISARALAPLPRLLASVHRHIAPTGVALLPKGQTAQSEIDEARKTWKFDLTSKSSQTQPNAAILKLERLARA